MRNQLTKTVSEIVGNRVTLKFAKDFVATNEGWGRLLIFMNHKILTKNEK